MKLIHRDITKKNLSLIAIILIAIAVFTYYYSYQRSLLDLQSMNSDYNNQKINQLEKSKFLVALSDSYYNQKKDFFNQKIIEGLSKLVSVSDASEVLDIEDKIGPVGLRVSGKVGDNIYFHSTEYNHGYNVDTKTGEVKDLYLPENIKDKYYGLFDSYDDSQYLYSIVNIGGNVQEDPDFAPKEGEYTIKFVRKDLKTGEEFSKYMYSPTSMNNQFDSIFSDQDFVYALRSAGYPNENAVIGKFDKDFNKLSETELDVFVGSWMKVAVRLDEKRFLLRSEYGAESRDISFIVWNTETGKIEHKEPFRDDNFIPNSVYLKGDFVYMLSTTGFIRRYDRDFSKYIDIQVERTNYAKDFFVDVDNNPGITMSESEFLGDSVYVLTSGVDETTAPAIIWEYSIDTGKLLKRYEINIPASKDPAGRNASLYSGITFQVLR